MSAARLEVIGVMGSGQEPHAELAAAAGRAVALRGAHLLTGGGAGVMAAVSAAFVATPGRRGLCLGVLKGSVAGGRYVCLGGPNPYVEVPIRTHLPDSGACGQALTSRNHMNVLSADRVVVLPGGLGTQSELELALGYGRPVVVFARPGDAIGALRVAGEALEVAGQRVAVVSSAAALVAWLDGGAAGS